MEAARCIYCQAPADSLEHPLPAAFGEFREAPLLDGRICRSCNNARLGILDEQLTRSGPEALLRRFYSIRGRSKTHEGVNVFERGSADGHRLDLRAKDDTLGIEIALEIENGTPRQMRHIVFVEESGKTHHLPIQKGWSAQELLDAFNRLGVVQPCRDVRFFYGSDEKEWVERLIKEAWPSVSFGEGTVGSTMYQGAVGTVVLTDRYFRAIAKIGFHYFLTQFPEYTGHEPIFAAIREFIVQNGGGLDRVNEFIGKRENALLFEMLTPGVRPNGWRAHVLVAEMKPGECLAYVQTFVTEDWAAPIYAVRLARDPSIINSRAKGHAYTYYGNGPEGKFAGDAHTLETTWADWPAPPLAPVIISA